MTTRSTEPHDMDDTILKALETVLRSDLALDQYNIQANELQGRIKKQLHNPSKVDLSEVEEESRTWLELTDNSRIAGLLNPAIRFMLRSAAVESVHDRRMLEGCYDKDLMEVTTLMDEIREREGLNDDEYWPIGEGPEDYEALEAQYSRILALKFEDALREFGLNDMADLHHQDRDEYDARREEGRLVIHNPPEDSKLLLAVRNQFESEADKCAESGAYHAASVMIGAAIESALLYTCLKHRDAVQDALELLPTKKRNRLVGTDSRRWNLEELAMVAEKAGWLPNYELDGIVRLNTLSLIKKTKRLRNLVHPGQQLRHKNAIDVEESFSTAKATYVLLSRLLSEIQST